MILPERLAYLVSETSFSYRELALISFAVREIQEDPFLILYIIH